MKTSPVGCRRGDFLIVCALIGEQIEEYGKHQNIQQINEGDQNVREELRRIVDLCLGVNGNHGYDNYGNHEQYSRCHQIRRVFFGFCVGSVITSVQDGARNKHYKTKRETNCRVSRGNS